MEMILLILLNIVLLIFDLKEYFQYSINIFHIIIFLELFFLYAYKTFHLKSRKNLLVLSSLLGVTIGNLVNKNILVIYSGFRGNLIKILGIVLLLIIIYEVRDYFYRKDMQ